MIKKRKNGIKAARLKAGLTQAQLALAVGVTQQAVSQWESGGRLFSVETLIRLSKALGCSVDDILPLP